MSRLLTAAVCICATSSVVAAMAPVTLQGLSEGADLIVYGQVGALESTERPAGAAPHGEMAGRAYEIRATVSPIETVKGIAPELIIVVALAGMEDQPDFDTGEHAVLFLIRNGDGETYRTVALAQGKLDVVDSRVVRFGMPVDDFLDKIRNLMRPNAPSLSSGVRR